MFVKILSHFIAALPIAIQLRIGDFIGWLWFDVLRIRRQVAMQNLKLCFPQWSDEERIRVARLSVQNLGRSFVEFLRIPSIAQDSSNFQFHIHGDEHFRGALAKGRGVFLLTAHIGNGDWATVGLALKGYRLHIISKEMKWRWLNRFWFNTRQSLGTEFISDRGSSIQILKTLKKNQPVVFMLDQFLGPPIGIKTTFFGRETGTAMGLALLAGRAEAPVVPVYTFRGENGDTHICFEPEIPFVEAGNKEDTIRNMTQLYCDKIEVWVRKHPEQWMWVHRRWKKYKH